jgi:AFG3 family protein
MLPILLVMAAAATLLGAGRQEAQEVSFQWFKTQLLAKGLVERLEVANKQTVKVCVGARGGFRAWTDVPAVVQAT